MLDFYRAGLAWLAHSGIQAASGGLSRYFAADTGQYRDISTEITGYAIQAYLGLPLPGEPGLLSHALRAGQFLCYDTGDQPTRLFPFEVALSGFPPSERAYFFDCGIIIRALLALWNTTADPQYLERAESCGAAMMGQMSRVDGSFFPLLDLAAGLPSAGEGQWSLEPQVYQLKVGLAFLELAEATSSTMFSKTAENLLQWSLRQHEMFLPGAEEPDQVADRLHAYCYFLEGLLPFVARRFDCAQVLQAGITRVEKLAVETRRALERSDVLAQLLRLRLIADYIGTTELDHSAANWEADSLPAFQLLTDEKRTHGAFSFGRRSGKLLPHANPVSTVFCLQALRMWREHQEGTLNTTWHELI
jgi:hypothetical protein